MATISEQYTDIINVYKNEIERTSLRQDSEEYQKKLAATIEKLVEVKSIITNKLALFSSNETLDDLSTSSIKFLSIDYYLGLMCSRKQSYDNNKDATHKNRLKLLFLEKAVQLFVQFIISLEDYEILDKLIAKRLNSFKITYKPSLEELYEITNKQSSSTNDVGLAYAKRQQKIEIFQHNKQLNDQIDILEAKLNSIEIDNDSDKEDLLHDLYIQKLKQFSYSAFNEIEQILNEAELLNNFIKSPLSINENNFASNDGKKVVRDSTGYTDRLESLNKPLLSKNGKILRNFTLVDKKTELRDKVRGYGQYGPTMSVEEFLEKEWEDGRVLQGGPDSAETQQDVDQDDNDYNDKETYKAREWDEFKETHAKGSGNTMNMG